MIQSTYSRTFLENYFKTRRKLTFYLTIIESCNYSFLPALKVHQLSIFGCVVGVITIVIRTFWKVDLEFVRMRREREHGIIVHLHEATSNQQRQT